MSGDHRPEEDKDRSAFELTPCATIMKRMMGPDGANGCCAEMMPRMKAACRRLALYAALALVALIGGTALLVWALFHFVGA